MCNYRDVPTLRQKNDGESWDLVRLVGTCDWQSLTPGIDTFHLPEMTGRVWDSAAMLRQKHYVVTRSWLKVQPIGKEEIPAVRQWIRWTPRGMV